MSEELKKRNKKDLLPQNNNDQAADVDPVTADFIFCSFSII